MSIDTNCDYYFYLPVVQLLELTHTIPCRPLYGSPYALDMEHILKRVEYVLKKLGQLRFWNLFVPAPGGGGRAAKKTDQKE